MGRVALSLISAVVLAGCAGIAGQKDSLSILLERTGQNQPRLTAYELGKRYLSIGNAGLAVDAFQRELGQNPNSIPALNGLAVAYDRLGRSDAAQQILNKALALDGDSAVTLNNLAYLNLTQGKHDVALAYGERAKAAAGSPTAAPLSAPVAEAVRKNVEIASQLAQRAPEEPVPPDADAQNGQVKRVSDNEWQLKLPGSPAPSTPQATATPAPEMPAPLAVPVNRQKADDESNWTAVLPAGSILRVSNGAGRALMAKRFAGYLRHHGLSVSQVANASSFDYRQSAVYYNPDQQTAAASIARALPFPVTLAEASRGRGTIEIILGRDTFAFDNSLQSH